MTICDFCDEEICEHGICYCLNDGHCWECFRRRELEHDAEREAAFQRDIAGPLLGFDREEL